MSEQLDPTSPEAATDTAPDQTGSVPATAAPDQAGPGTFPWPPADDQSVGGALIETTRRGMLEPAAFFRAMPPTGYKPVIAYALTITVFASGFRLFWLMIFDAIGYQPWSERMAGIEPSTPMDRLVEFFLSPLFALFALFLTAVLVHGALKLLSAANRPLVTTTRVLGFSYAPHLFEAVPFIGTMIAILWSAVMIVIGLREAHHTTTARAVFALLIPLALLMFLAIAVLVLVLLGIVVVGGALPIG